MNSESSYHTYARPSPRIHVTTTTLLQPDAHHIQDTAFARNINTSFPRMSKSSSLYDALDSTKAEIRLLEILPAKDEDQAVRCRMQKVSLNAKPAFCALSYVWGDAAVTKNIFVNDNEMAVTTNLEAALRTIRRRQATGNAGRRFMLWADAVSINQGDLKERTSQVQLMRRIYRGAGVVFTWVNGCDHESAFGTVDLIAKELDRIAESETESFESLNWLLKYPELCSPSDPNCLRAPKNEAWFALSDLFMDEYWRRAWIFQEVLLARRLVILSNIYKELEWDRLKLVVSSLRGLKDVLTTRVTERPGGVSIDTWETLTTPVLNLERIFSLVSLRAYYKSKEAIDHVPGAWGSQAVFLHNAVDNLRATNPKDHVYGLLGLTGLPIIPEYNDEVKAVADVYCEYTACLIKGLLNDAPSFFGLDRYVAPLQFLAISGFGLFGREDGFPTWVPNYPKQSKDGISTTRVAVGSPKNARLLEALHETGNGVPHVDMHTRSLHVRGVFLGTVDYTSEVPGGSTCSDGRLHDLARRACAREKRMQPTDHQPLQALFRLFTRELEPKVDEMAIIKALAFLLSLVAVYPPFAPTKRLEELGFPIESQNWDDHFMKAFFPNSDLASLNMRVDLRSLLARGPEGPIGSVVAQIRMNFIKLHLSWRYYEIDEGYIGLAPKGVQCGDRLYMLEHCAVPVLLRSVPNEQYFEVLGTSFVLGMMNGEMKSYINSEAGCPHWIELR